MTEVSIQADSINKCCRRQEKGRCPWVLTEGTGSIEKCDRNEIQCCLWEEEMYFKQRIQNNWMCEGGKDGSPGSKCFKF